MILTLHLYPRAFSCFNVCMMRPYGLWKDRPQSGHTCSPPTALSVIATADISDSAFGSFAPASSVIGSPPVTPSAAPSASSASLWCLGLCLRCRGSLLCWRRSHLNQPGQSRFVLVHFWDEAPCFQGALHVLRLLHGQARRHHDCGLTFE